MDAITSWTMIVCDDVVVMVMHNCNIEMLLVTVAVVGIAKIASVWNKMVHACWALHA